MEAFLWDAQHSRRYDRNGSADWFPYHLNSLHGAVVRYQEPRGYGRRHYAEREALPILLDGFVRDMAPIIDLAGFARQALLAAALTNGGWTVVYVADEPPKAAPTPELPKSAGTSAPVIPLRPRVKGSTSPTSPAP
jgi:hypothetical protein